jgi:hypothetical protein
LDKGIIIRGGIVFRIEKPLALAIYPDMTMRLIAANSQRERPAAGTALGMFSLWARAGFGWNGHADADSTA